MIDSKDILKLNNKQLKKYIIEFLNDELTEQKSNLHLKITNCLSNSNGSLSISKDLEGATIKLFINKLLNSDCSNIKVLINCYNTLYHEIEHSKSFFETKSKDFNSYEHLITLMEYIYYANIFKIDPDKIGISFFNIFPLKKILNNNYELSISEIQANLVGYKKSLLKFSNYMSEEDIKIYKEIIMSLEFLNKNLEICYDASKTPSNRFSTYVAGSAIFLNKNNSLIQKYEILGNVFNNDGSIKNIYELFQNKNSLNSDMYNRLIMDFLISINCDYTNYFKDVVFKGYIEEQISNYIDGVINYYKNMELGKVFVKNKKSLSYNLQLKKKNIIVLNEIIKKYGLNVKSGTVLDNTLCYRKNTLF